MHGKALRVFVGLMMAFALIVVATPAAFAQDEGGMQDSGDKMNHDHMMEMDKDMSYVYTADKLYTCDHHHVFVTEDMNAHCPMEGCGMAVVEMTKEQVTELRAKHLKGCPKCHTVLPADAEKTHCACGMEFMEIEMPEEEGEMMKEEPMDEENKS
ncbi:hypothetical protein KQI63_04885 [bacterium]|nr:hypothetical protein [bacterium]